MNEVVRDLMFYGDKLEGNVTLRISDVYADDEKPDELILSFEGEERQLRLNRSNRLLFADQLCGGGKLPADSAIGKTLTFGPATVRWTTKKVIKILPPEAGPKAPRRKRAASTEGKP